MEIEKLVFGCTAQLVEYIIFIVTVKQEKAGQVPRTVTFSTITLPKYKDNISVSYLPDVVGRLADPVRQSERVHYFESTRELEKEAIQLFRSEDQTCKSSPRVYIMQWIDIFPKASNHNENQFLE